ncbi:ribonuclease Z, mitochondrial isoform X2 [Onthophagus taurus]|uniref:ribonuclease Z, mitochondrial isoform X2 n=1 Tax=Onthophagus taurus TaxID=166361 RepID=UPI000C205846|nr:ribonuclease Z, mitochondrial isoform X2 [Onthophagus taurus]
MPLFLNRIYFRLSVATYVTKPNSNLLKILAEMPKDPKHIADAQKNRKKIKERSSKYVPGKVTLQVLGSGAEGAPRSLYVFSDQARYLFNCGEGTQRLAHEHKMKLAKLEHIFITQPVWKNIGGLPGTALTIQDVGVPKITLHGPQGLDELFVATKRFVVIKNLHIKMAKCDENKEFSDNVMIVQYILLERKKKIEPKIEDIAEEIDLDSDLSGFSKNTQAGSSMETSDASTSTKSPKRRRRSRRSSESVGRYSTPDVVEDNTDYYAHERKPKRKHRARSHSVSGSREPPERISESSQLLLSETKERGVSMAYICRLQPRPGSLNLDKCAKYGVPPGPLLGKLKNGENVTLNSGVVVQPTDVCEPDDPGPIFIVIDCPSEEYLDSLLENMKLKRHQKYAECTNDCAHLVVHFTPNSVVCHPKYQAWMEDFPPSTQHLILNEKNTCMGSIAVHRIQYKLNLLSRTMFPILGDKGTQVLNEEKLKTESIDSLPSSEQSESQIEKLSFMSTSKSVLTTFSDDWIQPNTLCSFHLRPRKGLDRSGELKLVPSTYIDETIEVEGFRSELQKLRINILNQSLGLIPRPYPKLLFLGTGSCIPNKTRNTSGILLETSDECKILVDCGEGTYGQLLRFFGPEKSLEILINTQAIYISHLHADHHIGLIGFLLGRRKALNELKIDAPPIILFAPKQILNWLVFYDRCFESFANDFDLIPNGDLLLEEEVISKDLKESILKRLNLTNINTVLVRHCPNAFGVSFTHSDGYKVTYSGDTMPCPNLVKLGKDSDLLIHEATMEDELASEAVLKMHSTTSQAISIGQQMNAKYTLLTHFSQRYARLPRFNENFKENVGIAFDNMQLKLDEIHLVPLFYPALKLMFAEHYEGLENKAIKRQLRIEREKSVDRRSLQKV